MKVRDLILQRTKACQPRHKFVTTLQVESVSNSVFEFRFQTTDLSKRKRHAVRAAFLLDHRRVGPCCLLRDSARSPQSPKLNHLPEFDCQTLTPSKAIEKEPGSVASGVSCRNVNCLPQPAWATSLPSVEICQNDFVLLFGPSRNI